MKGRGDDRKAERRRDSHAARTELTSGSRTRSGQRGSALLMVLAVAGLLGVAALSLTFTVTLDTLAARNVQAAVLAEGQAEGALALGAMEAADTATGASGGPMPDEASFGPWPELGTSAHADAVWTPDGVVSVRSHAEVGRSSLSRMLTARMEGGDALVLLSRP